MGGAARRAGRRRLREAGRGRRRGGGWRGRVHGALARSRTRVRAPGLGSPCPRAPSLPAEAAAPRAAADAVRAALGLGPDDGRPLAWYRLRDALACMLAESPEEWPEGLDDATWALIQRRVGAAGGWVGALESVNIRVL